MKESNRQNIWSAFENLSNMERLFGGMEQRFPVDVEESDATITVMADLPGVDKSNVNLKLNGRYLTIRVHETHEEEKADTDLVLQERRTVQTQRTITLPSPVSSESINATMRNGVLSITFHKLDDAESDVSISIEE